MGTFVNDEMVDTTKVKEDENDEQFYEKAKDYWSKIPATVNGVLGGFGFISKCDIKSSERFLESLLERKNAPDGKRALDCGAGIGRITKNLLMKFFKTVDLVEQNKEFIDKVQEYIGPSKKLGHLYCTDSVIFLYCDDTVFCSVKNHSSSIYEYIGLQSFVPKENYDVIWCQWVLGHLTDEDLVKFLKICQTSLSENGLIIVKENVTSSGDTEIDNIDSSITRGLDKLLNLFTESNLKVIKMEHQTRFPKGLYPVKMIALSPNLSV